MEDPFVQDFIWDIMHENYAHVSISMANHDYESNEIDDAFLLQAEIGIVYSPVLDDSPLTKYPFSWTPVLIGSTTPPPLKWDWLPHRWSHRESQNGAKACGLARTTCHSPSPHPLHLQAQIST